MSDPYVRRLLGDREKILLITRQHWSILVRNIIPELFIVLVILALITAIFLLWFANPLILFGYALIVFPFLSLLHDVLVWRSHEYIVTNRRVIQIFGVINKDVTDSSLEKVNDVKMEQSFLGRLLNYGDVEILTASELGINRFTRITDPIRFKTAMLNAKAQLEHLDQPAGTAYAPAPSGYADIPALIAQLGKLRQDGVLSEAEFQSKKQDLLSKL